MQNWIIAYTSRGKLALNDALAISMYPARRSGIRDKPLRHPGDEGRSLKNKVSGKDVLVVDDEPYLCDLMSDVLEAEGHEVRKASNGLEALEQIRKRKPQLVLLDMMMPVMDGWEFSSKLRSNPEWADIPVVIITADYNVPRKQHATGAKAVITKPFDIDHLADVVRTYAA